MAGIVRISIESDWNMWRTAWADLHRDLANAFYRKAFKSCGMPLMEGDEVRTCTKDELPGKYDHQEGIDILLYFQDGSKFTLQEKILSYRVATLTVETRKSKGAPGFWYYGTPQLYSVLYDQNDALRALVESLVKSGNTIPDTVRPALHAGIIVNWTALRIASLRGLINWQSNSNKKDSWKAEFKYTPFNAIPKECVIAQFSEGSPRHTVQPSAPRRTYSGERASTVRTIPKRA